MRDPAGTIRDLWTQVEQIGFVRDGVSDQAARGDLRVMIGYGCGAVRVRVFKAGDKIQAIDITDGEIGPAVVYLTRQAAKQDAARRA